MAKRDKQALKDWEDYRKALLTGTALETNKTGADIEKHRKYLEAHPVEWMKYMFPNLRYSGVCPIPYCIHQANS